MSLLLWVVVLWTPLAFAEEIVGDEIDQDGDGKEICYADADLDGYRSIDETTVLSDDLDCTDPGEAQISTPGGDCRDDLSNVRPGLPEQIGDGLDQNCDGVESCYPDRDMDGFAPIERGTVSSDNESCTDPGEATDEAPRTDCDDNDAGVNPDQTEIPNNTVDEDCDGIVEVDDVPDSGETPDNTSDDDVDDDTAEGCSAISADRRSALLVLVAAGVLGLRRRSGSVNT